MKRKMAILLLLSLVVIVAFYGVAFSGGGREDERCRCLPEPKTGPVIMGSFTVARDVITFGFPGFDHYNVQLALKKGTTVHLYSFPTYVGPEASICDPVLTTEIIKCLFERQPCSMWIEQNFGYSGIPVISEIVIQKKDFCNDPDNPNEPNPDPLKPMISGDIVIRVEPACKEGDSNCKCKSPNDKCM